MSLICPVCGASYNIPASVLGPKGRTVACAKCKHKWHAFPPEAENTEPAYVAPIEAAAPPVEKPAPPPEPPREKPRTPSGLETPQLEIRPAPERRDAAEERQTRLKSANLTPVVVTKPESAFIIFFRQFFPIASLIFLALIAAFLIMARSPITQRAPAMLKFYNMVGISPLPPGGGITIVNVRDESHFGALDNDLILTGELVNHTPTDLKVPLFKLIFTNPAGESKTFMARGPADKIGGGAEIPFRIERPGFAQEGWSVKLTFGDGSEGPDTGKALQTVASDNKPESGAKK